MQLDLSRVGVMFFSVGLKPQDDSHPMSTKLKLIHMFQ